MGISVLREINLEVEGYDCSFENIAFQVNYETAKGLEVLNVENNQLFKENNAQHLIL